MQLLCGMHDGGAEMVEHDAAGDATEELEGRAMQARTRVGCLVEDQLGVLMAAARQDHHENPRPANGGSRRDRWIEGHA